jgi:allophanate hydrolase
MPIPYSLNLSELRQGLRSAALTPTQIARDALDAASEGDRHNAWIHRIAPEVVMAHASGLEHNANALTLPLYGVPFAIKDNIDVAAHPTTAACPAFSYTPDQSATVVQKLIAAGAMLIGKTNLDQFATGLVGTRSPYGPCSNPFDDRYIAGGSSSGSALAVALNLVSFALGTDTAGSGRVPAGFNNIVGLKPTRGVMSTAGVVPACRTLDCVSIFANTCSDAWDVFNVARGHDRSDPYSRHWHPSIHLPPTGLSCGVPRSSQLDFCGDANAAAMFERGVRLLEHSGANIVEIDFSAFSDTAALLYQGPWVAERLAAIEPFFGTHQTDIFPVTREITTGGSRYSAVEAFEAAYRLQGLKQQALDEFANIDLMAVPTAPTIYTVEQIQADPITLNSKLGLYTNFVNLLDLAAIAVPVGMRKDGLPSGLTLIGPAFSEPMLCSLGAKLHRSSGVKLGATEFALPAATTEFQDSSGNAHITIAVVGAHLTGMPLNHQLTSRGARLIGPARTAARYRLYVLENTTPAKPGLVRSSELSGHAIDVELWRMPVEGMGLFMADIPPPLAIGSIELEDGRKVHGFVCESYAIAGARDISAFGGWRKFMSA